MVRVASLKDMVHAGYTKPDLAGMTAVRAAGEDRGEDPRSGRDLQYSTYNRSLIPALKAEWAAW